MGGGGGLGQDPLATPGLMVTPQLPMLLKRALHLFLQRENPTKREGLSKWDRSAKSEREWTGIWEGPEPTLPSLRALVGPFCEGVTDEPWMRQFVEGALELLEAAERLVDDDERTVCGMQQFPRRGSMTGH